MTTKTLTITRYGRSMYGNTANQTITSILVPTTGTLAIRMRFGPDVNMRVPATYKRFNVADINSFTITGTPFARTITVAVTYPDGAHSIDVPLCWTTNLVDAPMSTDPAGADPSLVVTRTSAPAWNVWDEGIDIDTATAITLT